MDDGWRGHHILQDELKMERENERMRREEERLRDDYIRAFNTPHGRNVLEDLLRTLHFFSTLDPDNPTAVAERNVAVAILRRMGVISDENTDKITEAILTGAGNNILNKNGGF
jgi:hypothetical protein